MVVKTRTSQRRFIRSVLKSLPWRDLGNLHPYVYSNIFARFVTLENKKIQQSVFVAKILASENDAPHFLPMINFRVPNRSVRNTTSLKPRYHRTLFGHNESISACILAFTAVEDLFIRVQ